MNKTSIWDYHYYLLEYPFFLTNTHTQPIFWFQHMVIEVAVYNLEYWATIRDGYLFVGVCPHTCFQERDTINHFPENEFFPNAWIFFKTQINPLGKTHEFFICKWVYQLFSSPQPCSTLQASMPYSLRERGELLQNREFAAKTLGSCYICFAVLPEMYHSQSETWLQSTYPSC